MVYATFDGKEMYLKFLVVVSYSGFDNNKKPFYIKGLLEKADKALYKAKQKKNYVAISQ